MAEPPDEPRVIAGIEVGKPRRRPADADRSRARHPVLQHLRLRPPDRLHRELELVPDILASYEVEDGRIFTLHLRKGHKWSDGEPFTAEDFRFYWEDVENNEDLTFSGPDIQLLVDGEQPKVEMLDELTIR